MYNENRKKPIMEMCKFAVLSGHALSVQSKSPKKTTRIKNRFRKWKAVHHRSVYLLTLTFSHTKDQPLKVLLKVLERL